MLTRFFRFLAQRPMLGFTLLLTLLIQLYNLYSFVDIPLLRDETYYWAWSRHLSAGYFDHPPMIAWLLALTTFFGDSAFAIRLPGLISFLVGLCAVYTLSTYVFNSRLSALYAVLLFLLSPAISSLLNVVTPDVVLFLFFWFYLWMLCAAVDKNRLRDWIFFGLASGLLMLSKYTAVFAPLCFALSLLVTHNGRKMLFSVGPYISALVAFLVISPMLFWNATNDWISFRFQLSHGLSQAATGKAQNHGQNFIDYLVSQATIYYLPLLTIIFVLGLVQYSRIRNQIHSNRLITDSCVFAFLFTFVFFGIAYTIKEGEANWTAIGVLCVTPLFGHILAHLYTSSLYRRAVHLSLLLTALLSLTTQIAVRHPQFIEQFGVVLPRTQITNAYGWQNLEHPLRNVLTDNAFADGGCAVVSNNHALSSWLGWHLDKPEQVQVTRLSQNQRQSQYTLWENKLPACILVTARNDGSRSPDHIATPDNYWIRHQVVVSDNPDGRSTLFSLYKPDVSLF